MTIFANAVYIKGCKMLEPKKDNGEVYLFVARGFHGLIPGLWLRRVKIGKTNRVERRANELNSDQAPTEIELIRVIECKSMSTAEKEIHRLFAPQRVNMRAITVRGQLVRKAYKSEWFDVPVWSLWKVHAAYDARSKNVEFKTFQSVAVTIASILVLGIGAFYIGDRVIGIGKTPVHQIHRGIK